MKAKFLITACLAAVTLLSAPAARADVRSVWLGVEGAT